MYLRALALALGMLGVTASAAAQSPPAVTPARVTSPAEKHDAAETLLISGIVATATTYVATGITTTALVMLANTRPTTIAESWIPLIGPWLMLADSRGFDVTQLALTVASGALQALGVATIVLGLVLESESHDAGVRIAPTAGGLSIAGWFS